MTNLPELPPGYQDTSTNEDEVCIEDGTGIMCDLMTKEDVQAAKYAIAKQEKYLMSRAEGLFSVAALLFNGKKVLAVSRKNNHEDLGLPGGKIDYGESPEEALVRELKEETGVTALKFSKIFEDLCRIENGESRPARVYLVYSWEGEPKAIENAAVEWVLPERLMNKKNSFSEYNKKLFCHLDNKTEVKQYLPCTFEEAAANPKDSQWLNSIGLWESCCKFNFKFSEDLIYRTSAAVTEWINVSKAVYEKAKEINSTCKMEINEFKPWDLLVLRKTLPEKFKF